MIKIDEDALICDFAETYGIFNYKSLPVNLAATFAIGLRADARIKLKMCDLNIPTETLFLAGILDKLNFIVWSRTEDGLNNQNRPQSILGRILNIEQEDNSDIVTFQSQEDYEKTRQMILKG